MKNLCHLHLCPRLLMAGACLSLGIIADELRAKTFEEHVSVIEIEIPVQVTANGQPIQGLTAEDFEVYDGKQKLETVGFEMVDLSASADLSTSAATTATAQANENSTSATPVYEKEEVQRHLLLLFDFLFTPPHELQRGIAGARKMITRQLHPADRMVVAYYGNTEGVVLLTGFTRDPRELDLALDVVAARISRKAGKYQRALQALNAVQGGTHQLERLSRSFGWSVGLALSDSALPETDVGSVESNNVSTLAASTGNWSASEGGTDDPVLSRLLINNPQQMAQTSAQQAAVGVIQDFSESLAELATILRDVRGPRHLLLFSEGFPDEWFDPMQPILTVVLEELKVMHQAFVRSGWILHSIDLAGIPASRGGRNIQDQGAPPTLQRTMSSSILFGSGSTANANDPLYYLANETGGELIQNYNYFEKATQQVLTHTSVTYVLHVSSGEVAHDGHFHRLTVKLREEVKNGRGSGARVSHRTGYYAPHKADVDDALEARIDGVTRLFSDEEIADLEVLTQAFPGDAGQVTTLLVQVDGTSLLNQHEGAMMPLEIQGYALDEAGGVIDYFVQELNLDLKKAREALLAHGLQFHADLDLPAGDYRLRLMVHNRTTLRTFLSTVPLAIPVGKPAEGNTAARKNVSPTLLPPFFLKPQATPVFAKEASAANLDVFKVEDLSLFPVLGPRLSAGESWPIYIVGSHLTQPGSLLEIRLELASGEPLAKEHQVQIQQRLPPGPGGKDRFLGLFDTTGLPPGSYKMELVFESDAGGARASSLFEIMAKPPTEDA